MIRVYMVKNFSPEAEVFVICVYHRDPTGKDKYRNEYGKGREKKGGIHMLKNCRFKQTDGMK